MSKNTGGPAFPTSEVNLYIAGSEGMTLRDYFAAKAMQGLLSQSGGTAMSSRVEDGAKYAYLMADAMLKEREK